MNIDPTKKSIYNQNAHHRKEKKGTFSTSKPLQLLNFPPKLKNTIEKHDPNLKKAHGTSHKYIHS